MTITHDDPRIAGAAKGLLEEAARAHVLGLEGRVTVELIDDHSGRVVERVDADNYVVLDQWQAFASAIQRLAWTWGYAGDSSTVTNSTRDGRDPRQIPSFRNDLIACWSDATAAATGDMFAFGEVTAWAHRWSQGSPSTRQGVVQPTLCTLADNEVKWVWEWATSNGNGSFQSVGWRRLAQSTNTGDAILADYMHASRRVASASGFTDAISLNVGGTNAIAATNVSYSPVYYDAGSGKLYSITFITGSLWKLVSAAVTVNANGTLAITAFADESAAAFAAGLRGASLAIGTATAMGITRLGASGDWISVGHNLGTTSRRPEIRRTTNAGAVSYTNANGATFAAEAIFTDVTYDGTDLWATSVTALGVNRIHRIHPATGTISASIASITSVPAYFPTTSTTRVYSGIEWDAVNGWLWVCTNDGYIFNCDTSGVWLGVLLKDQGNEYPISAAVLSGQHAGDRGPVPSLNDIDNVRVGFHNTANDGIHTQTSPEGQSAQQAVSGSIASAARGKLCTIDGDIWAVPASATFQGGALELGTTGLGKFDVRAFTDRASYGTRTDLGSTTTKNSSQTMRISYTITFV